MAAPIGNQFWKARSKHGRDKIFATPDDLWNAATEYFQWVDENPLYSYEWNGKDPVKCDLEKMRPYTLKGLCLFLGVNEQYFNQFSQTSDDFSNVCTRIRDTIHVQKFEGGAAGLLDRMIVVRDLGLIDKKEIEAKHDGALVIKGEKFSERNENKD